MHNLDDFYRAEIPLFFFKTGEKLGRSKRFLITLDNAN
jgi:hypothetical protein